MRVSPSQLKQFANCGRQYYYSRILGLGKDPTGSLTVLGTVVHFSLDVYETFGYDVGLAHRTFDHYWSHPELLGEAIDFWHTRTTEESLRKRGHEMIDRYHELAPWRGGRLIGTEIAFQVPLGDHTLSGRIDKLWVLHGKKIIQPIDFKTGSYVEQKLKFNVQFTAYCYATTRPEFWEQIPGHEDGYEKYKGYQRQGQWYHARNGRMFNAGFRTHDDYRRLLLATDEMERAIRAEVFPLDYSGEACGWCPFADEVCGAEIQLVEVDGIVEMVRGPEPTPADGGEG